jgi:hypothetical protein
MMVFVSIADIEAQAMELQRKKQVDNVAGSEEERVGLGEAGRMDVDIYGSSDRFGYYDSIATNEEADVSLRLFMNDAELSLEKVGFEWIRVCWLFSQDDDVDTASFPTAPGRARNNITAPLSILNDIPQVSLCALFYVLRRMVFRNTVGNLILLCDCSRVRRTMILLRNTNDQPSWIGRVIIRTLTKRMLRRG